MICEREPGFVFLGFGGRYRFWCHDAGKSDDKSGVRVVYGDTEIHLYEVGMLESQKYLKKCPSTSKSSPKGHCFTPSWAPGKSLKGVFLADSMTFIGLDGPCTILRL